MQYHYDLELASREGPALLFGQGHHDGFEESSEFADLAASGPYAQVAQHICQISEMFKWAC